jgi:hypothetical protein
MNDNREVGRTGKTESRPAGQKSLAQRFSAA